jgi:hypothetical protein
MVTPHFGHLCEPKHAAVLLSEEKPKVASALFANADETKVDRFARFIGPGLAGDYVGGNHGSCRGGLEEFAT